MTIKLNINQSPEELNEIYYDDYYWYLKSQPFKDAFLKPLGLIIDSLGDYVLDVGCGEGQLAEFVNATNYVGIDGSEVAINKAEFFHNRPFELFFQDRIEDPHVVGLFDTIVFGGLLHVLIAKENHIEFIQMYIDRYDSNHFIIYDLADLDTDHIKSEFKMIRTLFARAEVEGLQEIKKRRKIEVYQCKR